MRRARNRKPVKEVLHEADDGEVFNFLQKHYATILQICHNAGRSLMTGGSEMQWRNYIDRLLLDLFDDKPGPGTEIAKNFDNGQSLLLNDWMVITSYATVPCYDLCNTHEMREYIGQKQLFVCQLGKLSNDHQRDIINPLQCKTTL